MDGRTFPVTAKWNSREEIERAIDCCVCCWWFILKLYAGGRIGGVQLPLCGMSSNETRSIIVAPGQGATDAPIMAAGVDCNAKILTNLFNSLPPKKKTNESLLNKTVLTCPQRRVSTIQSTSIYCFLLLSSFFGFRLQYCSFAFSMSFDMMINCLRTHFEFHSIRCTTVFWCVILRRTSLSTGTH